MNDFIIILNPKLYKRAQVRIFIICNFGITDHSSHLTHNCCKLARASPSRGRAPVVNEASTHDKPRYHKTDSGATVAVRRRTRANKWRTWRTQHPVSSTTDAPTPSTRLVVASSRIQYTRSFLGPTLWPFERSRPGYRSTPTRPDSCYCCWFHSTGFEIF